MISRSDSFVFLLLHIVFLLQFYLRVSGATRFTTIAIKVTPLRYGTQKKSVRTHTRVLKLEEFIILFSFFFSGN